MRKVLLRTAIAAAIFTCVLGARESSALPRSYATPTPSVQPGVQQERWHDPINVARLIQFVPLSLRARAKQDFASWNSRLSEAPRVFAEKYMKAQNTKARQTAVAGAYQDQKALAFDKLALFERNGLGRFFFAPRAKTMTARLQYLHQGFQQIEAQQESSGATSAVAALFPSTSAYLASIGAQLAKRLTGTLVECAHADQNCSPSSRPRECQQGAQVCSGVFVPAMPIRPANNGPEIYRVMLEGKILGCEDEPDRGAEGLFSVYEIAETHYECANGKNVTTAPTQILKGKVYGGAVACQDGAMSFRNVGIYTYESGIEDGPIPDGCVGINKVRKTNPSQELTQGSMVILNAAPCWEGQWQCQYRENPRAVVTDTELMQAPDAPHCPS